MAFRPGDGKIMRPAIHPTYFSDNKQFLLRKPQTKIICEEKIIKRFSAAGEGNSVLTYSEKVLEFMASRCQVKQSGAREIDAVLNRELLPLLTDRLLAVESKADIRLQIGVSKDQLTLTKQPAAKRSAAKQLA
jgi:type VI secretion system protein VasG